MMKDWINKLKDEHRLTAAEEAQLDQALAEQERSGLASALQTLQAFEAPEGVLAGFDRAMARRSRMRFASAFGACAAASLALFAALNQPSAQSPAVAEATADSLYDGHNEAVATSILPGDGASLAAFSQIAKSSSENQ